MKKILVFILFLSVALVGCSSSVNIEGSWVDYDNSVYTFYKDGTIIIESFGIKLSGEYEFIEKDTIKLELDGLWGIGGATIFEVEKSGNQLTLTSSGQSILLEKKR